VVSPRLFLLIQSLDLSWRNQCSKRNDKSKDCRNDNSFEHGFLLSYSVSHVHIICKERIHGIQEIELTTTVKKDCRWEVVSSLEHEDEDV
jgi:hypothetical protein